MIRAERLCCLRSQWISNTTDAGATCRKVAERRERAIGRPSERFDCVSTYRVGADEDRSVVEPAAVPRIKSLVGCKKLGRSLV